MPYRLRCAGIVGGALFLLLIFIMPENNFQVDSSEERHSWQDLRDTLRNGDRVVRRSPPSRPPCCSSCGRSDRRHIKPD